MVLELHLLSQQILRDDRQLFVGHKEGLLLIFKNDLSMLERLKFGFWIERMNFTFAKC